MLLDVYSASLKCTPSHLSVEGEEAETWVFGKTIVVLHRQMLEGLIDGYSSNRGHIMWQAILLCHRSRWEQNTVEGGHYMDLQKFQGCRCLGGPVAGVLVAGGSVMAFSTVDSSELG